ncbi:ATP-binding cassette domain-containing protein [Xylanibacillus composti]|uniref:ABC transporter ATP-binding protein n=1 Tax=Xylanibacillus composti TaxID=1572762 RepID=A0A8J4M1T0_9BACL|nr:ATP-binding cassette domain-containing protein [Xylanibacillus composti]MDT9725878.1 ATP-binding cassette domain-containing protein [Xylanibacillus composti]GIQ69165.1 ABC transporter ATP-binding protein [Xylanibacillus composti]
MLAIDVKELRKEFRVQKNREGLGGALRDLFKREYNTVQAVKDISFQIPQGEICGYIGENGAGKSTTIKMLTGILVPTSGHLLVNGMVPYKEREKFVRGIGVVFGQRSQLWWDIGVIESFHLLRKVYRVPMEEFKPRFDELVERLQLSELLNRPVRKLSLGQRMRCELAASLLHNPSIVFLDEPTIGLDIVVKSEIREFLKEMNQKYETTILLTTHDLQDIEALCSRVIMLDDGNIIYDGGLDELKNRWGKGKEALFQFAETVTIGQLEQLTSGLPVRWKLENELTARVFVPQDRANISEVLARLVSGGGLNILDIKLFETGTDEIVREIYQSGSAEHKGDDVSNGAQRLAARSDTTARAKQEAEQAAEKEGVSADA